MKPENPLNFWHRWLHQPQKIWLRKMSFQVHLWAGIGAGLYIFVVCVTGSALVFRPEMIPTSGSQSPIRNRQKTYATAITDNWCRGWHIFISGCGPEIAD